MIGGQFKKGIPSRTVPLHDELQEPCPFLLIALGARQTRLQGQERQFVAALQLLSITDARCFHENSGLREIARSNKQIHGTLGGLPLNSIGIVRNHFLIGADGQSRHSGVHVDITEQDQRFRACFPHHANRLEIDRRLFRTLQREIGVGLKGPGLDVRWVGSNHPTKDGNSFLVLSRRHQGPRQTQLPVSGLWLLDDGISIRGLRRKEVLRLDRAVADQPEIPTVPIPEFHRLGQMGTGGLTVSGLDLQQTEILVSATKVRKLLESTLVGGRRLVEIAILEIQIRQDEIQRCAAVRPGLLTEHGRRSRYIHLHDVDDFA